MRKITDLLTDKLGEDKFFTLKALSNKYHCSFVFDFSVVIPGMAYCLFLLGMVAGSASAVLDLQCCELCYEAMAIIHQELYDIYIESFM